MVDAHALQHGMLRLHLVDVAVMRETGLHAVRGLGGPTGADTIGKHHVIALYVQRLARLEQVVGEGRHQEALASAGGSMQQQHGVADLAGGVALRCAQRGVVQPQQR